MQKPLEKMGIPSWATCEPLFLRDVLISYCYELSLPKKLSMNMKGIYIYIQKDFNQLDESQRKMITEHHEMTIILKTH